MATAFQGMMMVNLVANTMVTAANPIAEEYGLKTTTLVNFCVFIYFLFSAPATVMNMYLFQKYPTGMVLRFGISIQFFGSLFRMYSVVNGEFWPILVGHVIQAATGPLFLVCNILIINVWFSDSERSMVTGILTLGGAIGHSITFGASAILLNSGIGMREYLWDMMVFQNILFTIAFLSTIFLYKEKPDVPPSPVAEAKVEPLDVF